VRCKSIVCGKGCHSFLSSQGTGRNGFIMRLKYKPYLKHVDVDGVDGDHERDERVSDMRLGVEYLPRMF
jgi:hypothetical protein